MNTTTPSFFDYNLDPNTFAFTPLKLPHRHHLALQPLFVFQTTCKSLNDGTALEGIFKLQGQLLAYYKSAEKTSPEQVLDILNARVKTTKSSKYIVQLTKCQVTFELTFISKDVAVGFLECLKNICVFIALEDQYMPLRFFDQYPFSSAFVAKNKGDSEIYAIKRFNKQELLKSNSNANARLLEQIAVLRYLSHPNITPLHEIFETSSGIYFTKQYNPHETLDFILKRSNLQFANLEFQTAQILEAILLSLDYLASQGATFRTLNLNNVLIDREGNVKITDFYFVTKSNLADFLDDQLLYPGFIAPEIFKYNRKIPSTSYNEKCNIFSAGCILFELLFGFPLFFDQDFGQTLSLNKSFNYNIAADFINQEINDPQSSINKKGLKLLLKMLEPNFHQRISAREALGHSYFGILNEKSALKNKQVFVNLNEQARSGERVPNSLFSCSIADISNELSSEAVEQLYKDINKKEELEKEMAKEPLQKRRGVKQIVTKDTDALSSNRMNDSSCYNASILEDILGFSPKGNPTMTERIYLDCPEDNGEVINSDDEEESTANIQSFLHSHKIPVCIRSPGQ